MNLQPILTNSWISLRPLQEQDFEALYSVASDPLLWEQHPNRNRHEREVYQKLFREFMDTHGTLLVTHAQTQEVMGCSRYYDYRPEEKSVAIGYTMLARKFWGGVYNRELKFLMIHHALQSMDQVVFHVGEENIRSQKALEKIGAKEYERSVRNLADGRKIPQVHYRILKPDFVGV